jgi:hypothetical protein
MQENLYSAHRSEYHPGYKEKYQLRWLDIAITKTLLKNCKQSLVTIFTHILQKLINKTKELLKRPDVGSSHVIARVL